MLKILFQGDSLTDCGRDKTGHNPVQAYGYGYVNLIASKLLCDYPDTVVWNKAITAVVLPIHTVAGLRTH